MGLLKQLENTSVQIICNVIYMNKIKTKEIIVLIFVYIIIIIYINLSRRDRKKSRSPRRSRSPRNKRKTPERKSDEVSFDPTNPDKVGFNKIFNVFYIYFNLFFLLILNIFLTDCFNSNQSKFNYIEN